MFLFMTNIDLQKIGELAKRYQSGEIDLTEVKYGIYDLASIKPEDYKKLFDNLDEVLSFNGHHWQHTRKSNFFSTSWQFDKYVQEECFKAIEKLNPATSVVARKSTRELVEPHCSNKFLLKLDVRKYYESINFASIADSLSKSSVDSELHPYIERFYFSDGKSLRRGLSASPILSEFIGLKIDNLVNKILYEVGHKEIPYTRFYDDILMSSDDKEALRDIEKRLSTELATLGLDINKRKTRIQPTHTASILGLRIHNGSLTVPKEFKKKLRARIDRLEEYLDDLQRSGGWDDSDEVYEAKRHIGTIIGSHWYVIKNSNNNIERYSRQLDHYYEVLALYTKRLDYLMGGGDIVIDND